LRIETAILPDARGSRFSPASGFMYAGDETRMFVSKTNFLA